MTARLRLLLIAGALLSSAALTACSSSSTVSKAGTCLGPVSIRSASTAAGSASAVVSSTSALVGSTAVTIGAPPAALARTAAAVAFAGPTDAARGLVPVADGLAAATAGGTAPSADGQGGTAPSAGGQGGAAPSAGSQGGKPLPATKLGCLDGSGDVALTSVGRPMIVSFWATYCSPCQAETPLVEAFAKANAGTVAVVGVDSGDEAGKAKSFVSDFGMTYPIVSDPTTGLLKSVATPELPRLLFVTADGRIAYSYASNQLTAATLSRLATTYLGVHVR